MTSCLLIAGFSCIFTFRCVTEAQHSLFSMTLHASLKELGQRIECTKKQVLKNFTNVAQTVSVWYFFTHLGGLTFYAAHLCHIWPIYISPPVFSLLFLVSLHASSPAFFRGFTLIALKEGREGLRDDDHAGSFQVRHLRHKRPLSCHQVQTETNRSHSTDVIMPLWMFIKVINVTPFQACLLGRGFTKCTVIGRETQEWLFLYSDMSACWDRPWPLFLFSLSSCWMERRVFPLRGRWMFMELRPEVYSCNKTTRPKASFPKKSVFAAS